jgi:hypothetical protein
MVCHLLSRPAFGDGLLSHGVPSFRETGRRVENMARVQPICRPRIMQVRSNFEAWFRHLAKSLVQRADNAVIHNCRDTRVAFSPEKQHYITKRQWRHTDLHGHGESMHTCAGLTYPQKRYIDHVYLFHARPETPIYILKFEAQNNIEILIRHDRLQRLSDDFSFRVCLGRMPF